MGCLLSERTVGYVCRLAFMTYTASIDMSFVPMMGPLSTVTVEHVPVEHVTSAMIHVIHIIHMIHTIHKISADRPWIHRS